MWQFKAMQVLDFLLELLVVVAFQVHRALHPRLREAQRKCQALKPPISRTP